MALKNHFDALMTKYSRIEAKVADEMKRPLPDSFVLQRLKRQKLLVRDEIESWERLMVAIRPSKGRQCRSVVLRKDRIQEKRLVSPACR